jgi:hypothetical protein
METLSRRIPGYSLLTVSCAAATEHLMLMDQRHGVPQPAPGFMPVHLHILNTDPSNKR